MIRGVYPRGGYGSGDPLDVMPQGQQDQDVHQHCSAHGICITRIERDKNRHLPVEFGILPINQIIVTSTYSFNFQLLEWDVRILGSLLCVNGAHGWNKRSYSGFVAIVCFDVGKILDALELPLYLVCMPAGGVNYF